VAPAPLSVGDLVGRLRDDRADAAAAQVRADGFGRIRLVREHLRCLDHPAPTGCSLGPYELAA
jgi:hypothetical protein